MKDGPDNPAQSYIFEGIVEGERERILEAASHESRESGASYFKQGEPAECFYLLQSGRVKLSQVSAEGQQILIRFVSPGEPFGNIALSEPGKAVHDTTAVPVVDSEALCWDAGQMLQFLERTPRLALNVLRTHSAQVSQLQERLRELATERVERRIARALIRLTREVGRSTDEGELIDLPLSRQDVAEMTGTTLYSVSRVLSRWEQEGIVATRKRRLLVLDDQALRAVTENTPGPRHKDES